MFSFTIKTGRFRVFLLVGICANWFIFALWARYGRQYHSITSPLELKSKTLKFPNSSNAKAHKNTALYDIEPSNATASTVVQKSVPVAGYFKTPALQKTAPTNHKNESAELEAMAARFLAHRRPRELPLGLLSPEPALCRQRIRRLGPDTFFCDTPALRSPGYSPSYQNAAYAT